MYIYEVLKLSKSSCPRGRPSVTYRNIQFVGNLLVDFVTSMRKIWLPLILLGWRESILLIKIPNSTNWLVLLHQDIETLTLQTVEALHEETLLLLRPLLKEGSGREEEVILDEFDAQLLEVSVLG